MSTIRYCPGCGEEYRAGAVERCLECDLPLTDRPPAEEPLPPWVDLVTVAEHVNLPQAELMKSALQSVDIRTHVRSDDCGGMRPHLWLAGVHLQVRADDAERAREVLRAFAAGAVVIEGREDAGRRE